jgi:hypothetical protein
MANLDIDDDNTNVMFDVAKLQGPEGRASLKRVYEIAQFDDSMSFDQFVAMIETVSGVKIPELH